MNYPGSRFCPPFSLSKETVDLSLRAVQQSIAAEMRFDAERFTLAAKQVSGLPGGKWRLETIEVFLDGKDLPFDEVGRRIRTAALRAMTRSSYPIR